MPSDQAPEPSAEGADSRAFSRVAAWAAVMPATMPFGDTTQFSAAAGTAGGGGEPKDRGSRQGGGAELRNQRPPPPPPWRVAGTSGAWWDCSSVRSAAVRRDLVSRKRRVQLRNRRRRRRGGEDDDRVAAGDRSRRRWPRSEPDQSLGHQGKGVALPAAAATEASRSTAPRSPISISRIKGCPGKASPWRRTTRPPSCSITSLPSRQRIRATL